MSVDKLFDIQGKVVAITGGSGLIGSALSKGLAERGALVVAGSRGQSPTKNIQGVEQGHLDISSEKSMSSFFEHIHMEYGRLDALINNAWPKTKEWGGKFEDETSSSIRDHLSNHAGGYFSCCQHAAKLMRNGKGGSIVNMGSIFGISSPIFPMYDDTSVFPPALYPLIKGGIHAFSKYLACYLARDDIRVNCLAPGGIENDAVQDPLFQKRYSERVPLRRMGRTEDIVGPTVFLISEASRYVTGETLVVDGGWSAW